MRARASGYLLPVGQVPQVIALFAIEILPDPAQAVVPVLKVTVLAASTVDSPAKAVCTVDASAS